MYITSFCYIIYIYHMGRGRTVRPLPLGKHAVLQLLRTLWSAIDASCNARTLWLRASMPHPTCRCCNRWVAGQKEELCQRRANVVASLLPLPLRPSVQSIHRGSRPRRCPPTETCHAMENTGWTRDVASISPVFISWLSEYYQSDFSEDLVKTPLFPIINYEYVCGLNPHYAWAREG